MDKEVKAKWVETLESGKYRQGKGRLRSPTDEFCCLGVLCDIVPGVTWNEFRAASYNGNGSAYSLPRDLRTDLGVSELHEDLLGRMNDAGKTFPEIAAYIQEIL